MKVIVVGAYGFTGKLVCQQLNSEDIDFSIAGRSEQELDLLKNKYESIDKIIVADINTKIGVDKILDFDIVINCVGPFQVYADLLLEEVVKKGKIYFDISGEEVFVENSIGKYSKKAIESHALIVHAAAFESALVDVLVNLIMKELPKTTTIKSYYRFEKSKPSPGTRFTMKLSKFRDSFVIKNGEKICIENLENKEKVHLRDEVHYTMFYPMPEVPLIRYKFGLKNISSYLLVEDELSASISLNTNIDKGDIDKVIGRFIKRKTKGPTEEQRKEQYFDIIVKSEDENKKVYQLQLSGTDMYLVTAKIISYLVKTQLKEPRSLRGIVTPYELLNGRVEDFFRYVGVELESN